MSRRAACAVLLALALVVAGCGGDDEESDTAASSPTTSETRETATEDATTEESPTEPEEEPEATATEEAQPPEAEPEQSPEAQPGGGGDEEPARSLALFTGRGGRITPPVVRVPAFIAIRVELRARDGNSYGLTIGGKSIEVSDALGSASTNLPGLRPGQVLVGRPLGASGRVRVAATAEPGP